MKKLTILLSALMISGAAFAHEGKDCCKGKKENCHKEAKACKKGDKEKSCCSKKSTATAKK
jgi:hypothetical protein